MPALKYTASVDIQKTRYKKLVTHVEPQASAVSLLKRAENSVSSNQNQIKSSPRVLTRGPHHAHHNGRSPVTTVTRYYIFTFLTAKKILTDDRSKLYSVWQHLSTKSKNPRNPIWFCEIYNDISSLITKTD